MASLDEIVSKEAAQPRFRAVVVSGIAGLALLLAGIGLYGVVGYSGSIRTAEIGIRVALGADARQVMWMVLGEGLRLGLAGTAIGLAGAGLLNRLLASLLFGVTAGDPPSFASATILLPLVVLGASYCPARRASRVDPIVSLRAE